MISFKQIAFIFFTLSILLNSCTIEKRLHQKGFHVEWNNNFTTQNQLEENIENQTISSISEEKIQNKTIETKEFQQIKISENLDLIERKNKDLVESNPTIEISNIEQKDKIKIEETSDKNEKATRNLIKSIKDDDDSKKYYNSSILSFIFSIITILSIIGLIYVSFSFLLTLILGSILSLFFGSKANKKQNKLSKKGKFLSQFAVFIGLISIIFILIFIKEKLVGGYYN